MIEFVRLLVKALPMLWSIYESYKRFMEVKDVQDDVGRAWNNAFGVYVATASDLPKTDPKPKPVSEQPTDYPK